MIHETAIIDPTARLAQGVCIGPWSVIGAEVDIGEGTVIGPHVVIQGPTSIGKGNRILQFSSLGEAPQDMKYQGERTFLEIGDHNTIREFCTIHRGTIQDKAITRIGHHNLFMAYVHIAHDCLIGNHVIFANNASLAGHVIVEDYAGLGGFSGVAQFCRIGEYSFLAAGSMVNKDVPPFIKVSGYYAKPFGLNIIGLQRHQFAGAVIAALRMAYKVIYRHGLKLMHAICELEASPVTEVQRLAQFIQVSQMGIVR